MDDLVRNFLIVSGFAALPIAAWFGFLAVAKKVLEGQREHEVRVGK